MLDSISGVLSLLGVESRVLTLAFKKPGNWENAKDFEDLIVVLATFSQGVLEVLHEMPKVLDTRVELFRGFV